MKEIDFKVVQSLLKNEIDSINLKYIITFIILNILVAIVNWLIQKNVKSQDNQIYRKKVREDRRIIIIEDIYKEFVSCTYIFNSKETTNLIIKISELEKRLSENRLYINKSLNNKLTLFIDYLKEIATDFRKKVFNKENKMLNDIEKEFNN